jgi:ABC-type sugar transport system substrate-binding protein
MGYLKFKERGWREMKAAKLIGLGLLLALCVALAAGCGSDSDSSSSSSASTSGGETETSGGGDAGIEKATEEAALYEEERTGPEVPELSEPAPGDLTVSIATCPIPACAATTDGAKEAAEELGWKIDYKIYELTPESYQKTVAEIAKDSPDAFIWVSAFPNETIEDSLKSLHDDGAAVVQLSPQAFEKPTELVPSVLQGGPFYELGGAAASYKILADAGEATDVTVVYDPSFGVFVSALKGFEKSLAENCAECNLDTLEVALSSPAPQQMSQVTNYLAQNPDVKYLFFTVGDQAAVLPETLEAAGLNEKVQFVTLTAGLPDLEHVKEGKQLATIQNENFSAGYRAVDAALRILIEGTPEPQRYPDGYTRILSEANVVPGKLPTTPGTPQDYLKAWGVEG